MSANAQEVNKAMKIASQSFENQKDMAKKITCDGEDISPALEWSDVPAETKSFDWIISAKIIAKTKIRQRNETLSVSVSASIWELHLIQ